ncbi:hypothetical protein BCR44DRAFT_76201 [Catenaria anguillulae PL171]|uniref:Uncharacterized protein n=1 Tax=Catenaria anguillulae PL171 TaxID=765915 RepID=A0A1Y2H8L9_9FUNG|nr:hypothetical protein BCR44DRAFT_76201 [Catenaria anguillulae PL171]
MSRPTNTSWSADSSAVPTPDATNPSSMVSTTTTFGSTPSPTTHTSTNAMNANATGTESQSSDAPSTETATPAPRLRIGPIERPGLPPPLNPIADPEPDPTPSPDPPADGGNGGSDEPAPPFGIFLAPIMIDPDPLPLNDTVHIPALATATPPFLGVAVVPPRATTTEGSQSGGGGTPPLASLRAPLNQIAPSDPPMPSASVAFPPTPTNPSLPSSPPSAQPSISLTPSTPSTCGNNVCDATDKCATCPQDCSFARPVLLPLRHLTTYKRALEPLRVAAAAGSQQASDTLQRVQRIVQGTESKVIACDAPHIWQTCQRPAGRNGQQQQTAAVVVMGDVHPHPVWTVKAIDALSEVGVAATVFLNPHRMMGHGIGPDGDLAGVRRAVKHALRKGHSLGLLATEAPISVATLTLMHDVYSRLPNWLDLADSDSALGVLDVPPAPASTMYPSWAPTGLHIASPMYLTYPSLPLSTTRALILLNTTLVVPTFPVHESMLAHLLIPDLAAAMDVVEYHLDQLKGHTGLPGWMVSIEANTLNEIKLIEPIVKVLRERVGVRIVEGGIKGCDQDRVGASVGRARDVVDTLRGEAKREPVVGVEDKSAWAVGLEDGHEDRDEFLFVR